jgi:hypothetical protein
MFVPQAILRQHEQSFIHLIDTLDNGHNNKHEFQKILLSWADKSDL